MSRRGKGEGSVYQRASDGRWIGVVDLGWIGGKRVRKTVSAHTKRECQKKRNDLARKMEGGLVEDGTVDRAGLEGRQAQLAGQAGDAQARRGRRLRELHGAVKPVPIQQAKRGDLLFWGPGGSQHEAIYLGGGQMLEAQQTGVPIKISPVRMSGMTPYVVRIIES